ncbi:MAG: branched-chain amino acid ABC transporter permease [Actinobacteria bacterium]|nr:branched-chain amino acid ABC transporter permease [Actinomycetota bacterium]NDF10494.1 branched-chain amino acid ABC transporter permease [Actinomycetota bacterium]
MSNATTQKFKGTPGQIRNARIERAGAIVIGAIALVWILANIIKSPEQFAQVTVLGLRNGLLYALIALGYTLVYGIIELINFAHGDLFMLGTLFSSYFLSVWLKQQNSSPTGWAAFAACLLLVMVFGAVINVLIERLAYRRLRNAPRLAPLITAVGMSFLLNFIGLKWNGSTPRQWPTVIPSFDVHIFGVRINMVTIILFFIGVPLLLGLNFIVNKTKQGKAMRATAQDKDAAALMGINVNKTIAFTFALGGAMAGAAGLFYQQAIGTTNYNLGFQLGLIAFTSAVLGGIGNLWGAVVGALLIGLIQGLNDGLPIALGQQWSQSVVFTILIIILVFKPAGLLGKVTTEKV